MEGFSTEEIPNLHDEAVVPDRKKNGKMHKRYVQDTYKYLLLSTIMNK